jgi:putative addiction module killer protein
MPGCDAQSSRIPKTEADGFRIDCGPGYRVYFVQRGETLVVLLTGGDKATQDRDIRTALGLARDL